MSVKKGLGKGLDIMIPEQIVKNMEVKTDNVSRETFVKISDIEPNKSQPRKRFDEDSLQELADSIKQYGVIQPLILQKRDKYYEVIAGERRWRAARMAGLKEVPAVIKDYSPQEIVEIALIENIQREDLNPIEEAQTYYRLIQEFKLKQDEVAERVSKSRVAVTNCMRLLKLDERVQQMLIDEMLSSGHARALLSIDNSDKQHNLACKVFDEKLSVRETERLVKQILTEKPHKEIAVKKDDDFIYRNLEDKIRGIVGTKVAIHNKQNNKGTIEIDYYTKDELERIMDIFESFEQ